MIIKKLEGSIVVFLRGTFFFLCLFKNYDVYFFGVKYSLIRTFFEGYRKGLEFEGICYFMGIKEGIDVE